MRAWLLVTELKLLQWLVELLIGHQQEWKAVCFVKCPVCTRVHQEYYKRCCLMSNGNRVSFDDDAMVISNGKDELKCKRDVSNGPGGMFYVAGTGHRVEDAAA
jgi:hypothetical protein